MTFTTTIESNVDEVIAAFEAVARERARAEEHVLTIVNESPWALWLQRRGYWVMNDEAARAIVRRHLAKAVDAASAAGELLRVRRVVQALDDARDEIVRYYQQVVGAKNTAGRAAPPPRDLHRGGYADDTLTTARSFVSYIDNARERKHPY